MERNELFLRYFPEPDLPPLVIDNRLIEEERAQLPELPDTKCHRLQQEYGLTLYDAQVLADTRGAAYFFEVLKALEWPLW